MTFGFSSPFRITTGGGPKSSDLDIIFHVVLLSRMDFAISLLHAGMNRIGKLCSKIELYLLKVQRPQMTHIFYSVFS